MHTGHETPAPLFALDDAAELAVSEAYWTERYMRLVHANRFRPTASAIIEACETVKAEGLAA